MEIRRIANGFVITDRYRCERAYKTIEELLQAIYNHYGPFGAWRDKVIIVKDESKED